jgi:hypothetical protein
MILHAFARGQIVQKPYCRPDGYFDSGGLDASAGLRGHFTSGLPVLLLLGLSKLPWSG